MMLQFVSIGELPAGFSVGADEAFSANRDVAAQFARLLDIDTTQLTVVSPNFLAAEMEMVISATKASDVHTAVLEASLDEQLKVSGFEFSYNGEAFIIPADCSQYNSGSFEGAAAGCGAAVGCLWSAKDSACGSPRDDASKSSSWAAPEIKLAPKGQATAGDETNNGQLIMIIVVIVGFFVLVGIAFMYVRRKKARVVLNPVSYEAPMSAAEVKNAAYDDAIEAAVVMDNAPVRDRSTGMISYAYGETESLNLDEMDEETAFNEFGAMPLNSTSGQSWNCGTISRKAAERMLERAPPGGFLVRTKEEGGYVLTMVLPKGMAKPGKTTHNFRIHAQASNNAAPPNFVIDKTPVGEFSSLDVFIEALQQRVVDPLPCKLVAVPLQKKASVAAPPMIAWNLGEFDEMDF